MAKSVKNEFSLWISERRVHLPMDIFGYISSLSIKEQLKTKKIMGDLCRRELRPRENAIFSKFRHFQGPKSPSAFTCPWIFLWNVKIYVTLVAKRSTDPWASVCAMRKIALKVRFLQKRVRKNPRFPLARSLEGKTQNVKILLIHSSNDFIKKTHGQHGQIQEKQLRSMAKSWKITRKWLILRDPQGDPVYTQNSLCQLSLYFWHIWV